MVEMKLMPEYFDKIKSGKKIYEVRLNDEKRKIINVGDNIRFLKMSKQIESIETIVTGIEHFENFKQMANSLNGNDLGFGSMKVSEIVSIYHTIYSKDDENKYGVVAFKLEVK